MTSLKDLTETLPFHPYSTRKPLGIEQAEWLLLRAILNDPDYDIGSLSRKDFRNTVYGLIFDVWLNLKKQDLPRGIEEVAAQLRHEDLIGKNGLEIVGEAFLICLQEYGTPHDARDTVLHNSIIRNLQIRVAEENFSEGLKEVAESMAAAVKDIP